VFFWYMYPVCFKSMSVWLVKGRIGQKAKKKIIGNTEVLLSYVTLFFRFRFVS
jgi:hypothetical protein